MERRVPIYSLKHRFFFPLLLTSWLWILLTVYQWLNFTCSSALCISCKYICGLRGLSRYALYPFGKAIDVALFFQQGNTCFSHFIDVRSHCFSKSRVVHLLETSKLLYTNSIILLTYISWNYFIRTYFVSVVQLI